MRISRWTTLCAALGGVMSVNCGGSAGDPSPESTGVTSEAVTAPLLTVTHTCPKFLGQAITVTVRWSIPSTDPPAYGAYADVFEEPGGSYWQALGGGPTGSSTFSVTPGLGSATISIMLFDNLPTPTIGVPQGRAIAQQSFFCGKGSS
jgi:hypothetical protein